MSEPTKQPPAPRYCREVHQWHAFFNEWQLDGYEGSDDGTIWFRIPEKINNAQQCEPRRLERADT